MSNDTPNQPEDPQHDHGRPETQPAENDEQPADSATTPMKRKITVGSRQGAKRVRSVHPTLSLPVSTPQKAPAIPPPAPTTPVNSSSSESGPPPAQSPPREQPPVATTASDTTPTADPAATDAAPKAPTPPPTSAPPPPALPPRPSRRDRLSPELEAEIAAAMGGVSVEEVLGGTTSRSDSEGLEMESRHVATVVKIFRDDVFFSLGGSYEGAVSLRQFEEPPEIGQEIDVVVTGMNAEDGLYELRIPGAAVSVDDWSDLVEGSVVDARVSGVNTGGLEVMLNQIRGFIPASQVALYHVENLSDFIGEKIQCTVTEVNPWKKRLVLSRRAVLEREREEARQKLLEELDVGQSREGVVRNIRDFGAFVDLGGVDGLIHISQLSWDRVEHPGEILQVGQKVNVRIEKVDRETGKIGLSYRNLTEHPWTNIEQRFAMGSIVKGVVTRVAKFGAFVKLAPGIEGLIHISELAHHRVHLVSNVVKEGQEVEVKVLTIDPEEQRIGLSLKAAMPEPEKPAEKSPEEQPEDDPPRELAVRPRRGPLKGGTNRTSGGDQFGLKW